MLKANAALAELTGRPIWRGERANLQVIDVERNSQFWWGSLPLREFAQDLSLVFLTIFGSTTPASELIAGLEPAQLEPAE